MLERSIIFDVECGLPVWRPFNIEHSTLNIPVFITDVPATQRPSDPATQRPSDPATQRPSDPATQRPSDAATQQPSNPANYSRRIRMIVCCTSGSVAMP